MSAYPSILDFDNDSVSAKNFCTFSLAKDFLQGQSSLICVRLGEGGIPPESGTLTLVDSNAFGKPVSQQFLYQSFIEVDGFIDFLNIKPLGEEKSFPAGTLVTHNVLAKHHNTVANSLIRSQKRIGVHGQVAKNTNHPTLEGRVNFLREVVLSPKAWFVASRSIGLAPLTVLFENKSFRLVTDGLQNPVDVIWDFGDGTILKVDADKAYEPIEHTYANPGVYDVRLTVENSHGRDTCFFPNLIQAKVPAPHEAILSFQGSSNLVKVQKGTPHEGPYQQFPSVRASVNEYFEARVFRSKVPGFNDRLGTGERVLSNGLVPDRITRFEWELSDDLNHGNSPETRAVYSVGGIYDLKLRVFTELGSYRYTTYENAIDVVEKENLWLWIQDSDKTVRAYEYGLLNQTFKPAGNESYLIERDDSFLQSESSLHQNEFQRNVFPVSRGNTFSGDGGNALVFYSSGRSENAPVSDEKVASFEFNGFHGSYDVGPSWTRPWNWMGFAAPDEAIFCLGNSVLNNVDVNQQCDKISYADLAMTSFGYTAEAFDGSQDLLKHPTDGIGSAITTYRSAWSDRRGYFVKNDGVGIYYRLQPFYRTEGVPGQWVQSFLRLQDIQGGSPQKLSGSLESLSDGLYFFTNSGSVSYYDTVSSVWYETGPGHQSSNYRASHDPTVGNYESPSQSFLSASTGEDIVMLSYDYSPNAFFSFNRLTQTFLPATGGRPVGQQFSMLVY